MKLNLFLKTKFLFGFLYVFFGTELKKLSNYLNKKLKKKPESSKKPLDSSLISLSHCSTTARPNRVYSPSLGRAELAANFD